MSTLIPGHKPILAGPADTWPGVISGQFAAVTGTTATPTDIATWSGAFQDGAPVSYLHTALAYTPAAEAALGRIIAQGTGQPASPAQIAAGEDLLAGGANLAGIKAGPSGPFIATAPVTAPARAATATAAAVAMSSPGQAPGQAHPNYNSDPMPDDPLSAYNWASVFHPIEIQVFGDIYARVPNGNDDYYWRAQLPGIDNLNGTVQSDAVAFKTALRRNLASQNEAYTNFEADWQNVLGRSIPGPGSPGGDLISFFDGELASGAKTRASLLHDEAYSQEALNDIYATHQSTLGTNPSAADIAWAQATLAAYGNTQGGIRYNWSTSPAEQTAIAGFYQAILGRPGVLSEWQSWEAVIAAGTSQASARMLIASSTEAQNAITQVIRDVDGRAAVAWEIASWQSYFGTTGTLAYERAGLAGLPEAAARVNDSYLAVLGRAADPGGLSTWTGLLAGGWTQTRVRMGIAASTENASNIASLYSALLGRGPSADETAGMQAATGVAFSGTPLFTLTGQVNGAAQTFATGTATADLTELAVYVTLNSGVTPTLIDPYGTVTTFANATQLAGYLLGAALETGAATPVLLSTYALTVNWLAKINQQFLQWGENELIAARAAQAAGNAVWQQEHEVSAQVNFDVAAAGWNSTLAQAGTYAAQAAATLNGGGQYANNYAAFYETAARVYLALGTLPAGQAPDALLTAARNFLAGGFPSNPANTVDATNIANAEADEALQNEALAPASRHAITERLISTQSSSTTIDVTVDQNGYATVHSKDQSASPVLGIVTAVLDIAAVLSGQDWALALTAALNAGESVSNFAQGNALAGVLDLGTAAGLGAGALGALASGGTLPTTQAALNAVAGHATLIGGTVGGTLTAAGEIAAGTALVGGLSGIVNSAENNDGLGIAAATLETAAAVAGGLVTTGTVAGDTGLLAAAIAAAAASGVLTGVDAIKHGHVADGLVNSLGALVSSISSAQQLISNSQAAPANAVADWQGAQYAQNTVPQNYTILNDSTPQPRGPLIGKTVTVSPPNAPSFTGTVGDVSSDGNTVYLNGPGGSLAPTAIGNVSVAAGIGSVTASGIALEVAALNTAAAGLRLSGILASELAPFTLTLSVLINAYATFLKSLTVFQGTVPNTNISFVSDLRNGIFTVQQAADNYVQLAIGTDGTLTTANGQIAGSYSIYAGLTLNPVFQIEWNAGAVDGIGDSATVFENRAQGNNLTAAGQPRPPPGPGGPYQDHHNVPQGKPDPTKPWKDATPAQGILSKYGVDIDSVENGTWLSRGYHQTLNENPAYYNYVNTGLRTAGGSRADVSNFLNQLRNILQQADKNFQAGLPNTAPF